MKTDIQQWIEIDPLDTLFFRGSEPMVAGQNHEVRTIFPPMPSTVLGALRSAIIIQRKVDLSAFVSHDTESPFDSKLVLLGSAAKSGFSITGPILEAVVEQGEHEFFLPAPAHWIGAESNKTHIIALKAAAISSDIASSLGLDGSSPMPLLVDRPPTTDHKSLHGLWTNSAAFEAVADGISEIPIKTELASVKSGHPVLIRAEALFCREQRIGIALDPGFRRVRKGHLFGATHVRVFPGVVMLIGLSEELVPEYLDPEGLLHLGGEQRLVQYRLRTEKVPLPPMSTGWALALAPVEFDLLRQMDLINRPRASGSILRMAGWDMKNSFHKPVKAYLPAGSVIEASDRLDTLPFGFIGI